MPNEIERTARAYVVAQFVLILLFAAAVFLDPRASPDVPPGIGVIGLALCGVGLAIMAGALAAMGRVMQVSPEPKAEGRLITGGIYRVLRHPMYTGIMLIAVGLALRRPTWIVGLVGAALVVMLVRKSRFEERLLAERYPDYAAYRARTWGVITPRL